ncbi:FMN-binding protein [Acidipropionibacterium acidipropionici]|uniref:FMN-binding protein n=1 Tax=Acidipropionibacterium acidipropionici TaxID=1748 RepID=UPI001C304443|nr:FMN-binding protein [Acidipropionibacterium acidipropionici]
MMKKAFTATMGAVSAVVLAGSYYASLRGVEPSANSVPQTTTGSATSGAGTTSGTSSSSSGSTSTSSKSTAASSLKDGTYTGSSVQNPFGTVQVQVTISGGKITSVKVPQYPTGHHSDEINQQAVPTLVNETISAQSSQVDMVSGATFTSQGYTTSLQNALDQAKA